MAGGEGQRPDTPTASIDNTRPTSSLSNYEIIDDTPQTHSPFELTPSVSPNITAPKELTNGESMQEVEEDTTHMPNEHIDPFHGDKEDENPEDFLRSFYRRMETATEETKKTTILILLTSRQHCRRMV